MSEPFFDLRPVDAPEPEPETYVQPAWHQPPPAVLPGRVLVDGIVHRDDALLIWVREVARYEEGVSISLRWARRRRPGESMRDWNSFVHARMGWGLGGAEGDELRLGVQLPGGRKLIAGGGGPGQEAGPGEPTPPTISMYGGGGGGGLDLHEQNVEVWLWSPGALPRSFELVIAWAALGVPESRFVVSADMLAGALHPRPFWD
ncbi:hypothetical protein [Agromyces salentinus]|uniref:Uncharacterized protein n=1 Tax=Agromyces salentinus TaxID=269421 RepID=A0ABP4YTN3_9MICO|nr:hypothetical protein [Agromyces salentinus]